MRTLVDTGRVTDGDPAALWPTQHLFRLQVEMELRRALELAAAPMDVVVALVGFPVEGGDDPTVDPATAPIRPDDVASVPAAAAAMAVPDVDETADLRAVLGLASQPSPEDLRRLARARALVEAAGAAPGGADRTWFAGESAPIGGHDVHVLVGLRTDLLDDLPRLGGTSLLHGIVGEVLRRADLALRQPYPGAERGVLLATGGEVVRAAARRLLDRGVPSSQLRPGDRFDSLNALTALAYEQRPAQGRIVFVDGTDGAELRVVLADPVDLTSTRAARKLLEVTDDDLALVVDDGRIVGFGTAAEGVEVVVPARATWELHHAGRPLVRVAFGNPTLPRPLLDRGRFDDVVARTLGAVDPARLWAVVEAVSEVEHGTAVVFSADAAAEARRLAGQATPVDPVAVDTVDLQRLASIDGALLLDLDGRCHAVAVILDGTAVPGGSPARGARYNSAVRYQASAPPATLVVVVSEDGTVDLVPALEPRIRRQAVTDALEELRHAAAAGSIERFARAHNRVAELAFYLSPAQCEEANALFDAQVERRIPGASRDQRYGGPRLAPHPALDDSYFLD